MESMPPTSRRPRLAPAALATFAALATLPAQGLSWTQMAPPQAPPVRGWSAMAFDAARQQVVLHGYAFLQLPIYQRVNGLQIEPRYTATIGVYYTM